VSTPQSSVHALAALAAAGRTAVAGATRTAAAVTSTPAPVTIPKSAGATPGASGSSLPTVSLDTVRSELMSACGNPPGFLCRTVYDTTHSNYLASGAEVFLGTPLTIVLILLVAGIVRTLAHRIIRRTTGRVLSHGGMLRGGILSAFGDSSYLLERRRQRAETVSSLLRSVVSVVVFGIAFVLVLGELGINLAPIVASAGVIGIAVGFGAQNLVKDVLAGIFMLLEDQYGVGDVVDVGAVSGTIEAVTFRMTRLRDVEGTVWYIPNGQITRIGNKSQQWARTVLDVPLDYDTDVTRAKAVLLETATTMWRDEHWATQIIGEPEVWGMETMSADGYTLRVAVRTQPLKQWNVARELRERTRLALGAAGISLGTVQRTLVVEDNEDAEQPSSDEDGSLGLPGRRGQQQFGDDTPPHIDPPAQPGPSPSTGPGARRVPAGAGSGSGPADTADEEEATPGPAAGQA
jgi:small conductance mechanosensitive channel